MCLVSMGVICCLLLYYRNSLEKLSLTSKKGDATVAFDRKEIDTANCFEGLRSHNALHLRKKS